MTVSRRPVQIDGEVLQPPQLQFSGPIAEMPRNGVWNVMNKTLYLSRRMGRWAVVDLSGRRDGDARKRFLAELEGCLKGLGNVHLYNQDNS